MFKFFKIHLLKSSLHYASLILICAGAPVYGQDTGKEPIAFIGHGAMFDQSGNEVVPTIGFIREAQAWYRNYLVGKLTAAQRTQFSALEARLTKDLTLDPQSQLVLNAHLLDWLINTAKPKDADRILGKNNLMKRDLQRKLSENSNNSTPRSNEPFKINPELDARLTKESKGGAKSPNLAKTLVNTGGAQYRTDCKNTYGVPVPPDFGPGSAWVSRGVIAKSDLFIVRSDDAEVLTYQSASPPGMCIALPRFNGSNIVEADGVICLGATGNVCFWDNEKNGTVFTFTRGTAKLFSDFGGGTELRGATGGVCSDCHAGENPYIIHGPILGGLQGAGLPTFAGGWYNPIVRAVDPSVPAPWPNNPGPMNSPGPCAGCHGTVGAPGFAGRLPHLSPELPGYCAAVLRSSIGALAPPLSTNPAPLNVQPPATMPQGAPGTLACTPGLVAGDARYRACSAATTVDCTPTFQLGDPRIGQAAYKVSCTPEMASLLDWCGLAASGDAATRGDPHLTTFNGVNYDFQSAGEFVALRSGDGMEIQTRHTPVATAAPAASAYTGLASCVSLNTAVAARVGKRRVTYQPDPTGEPEPRGLQLRVDGKVTSLSAAGINLGGGNKVVKASAGTGIEMFFSNGTHLIVTSNFWGPPHNKWYLNVDVASTEAREGLMGAITPHSWLPLLPNGAPLGPKPASLHQRYLDLTQKLANAWRVTNATSLFDYAPGKTTKDFTDPDWPPENPPCVIPGSTIPPTRPMDPRKAEEYCSQIKDKNMKAQCVFDVTLTGEAGFAKAYLATQQIKK